MADRDAHGVALLLQHLALLEQLVPGLRRVLEPRFLEVRHVVRAGERHPEPGDGLPPGFGLAALRGERIPAAPLLADLVDHIIHAYEEILVAARPAARLP